MPIVTIECVQQQYSARFDSSDIQSLTDKLGHVFGSQPSTTWTKLRYVDQTDYAENETVLDSSALPTFVNVLLRSLPSENLLEKLAQDIAACVCETLNKPQENVHVIFEPEGYGRVAFGGVLVKKTAD